MRFSPIKFLHGLLYTAPVLFLTLASCGGGGSSTPTTTPTPTPVTIPAAPTGVAALNVSGCNAKIQISWTASIGATGYNVYRSTTSTVTTGSTKLTTPAVTASPYIDTALTVNTASPIPYWYVVTAINSAGESPVSATVTASIPATLPVCKTLGGSQQGSTLSLTGAVTTVAGTTGISGMVDGTGTSASFSGPVSLASDGTNIYIADTANNRIRQFVIATAAVSTLATGLNGPKGITVDDMGNLYVADTGSHTIRMIVIATKAVSIIAGSGISGFADGISTAASFNLPTAITFAGTGPTSTLYIADTNNHLIRKLVISSGVVTTIAGTTTAGFADGTGTAATFNAPHGITTDGTNLYIADTVNCAIRKMVISSNVVTTVAGMPVTATCANTDNGLGTSARFNLPQGITTDGVNLYVADTVNHTIRKIVPASSFAVSTVAGAGPLNPGATDGTGVGASFTYPAGITTDGSSIYDADNGKNTIRRIQ
jgi:sugar lactone lactonase YvrE